MILIEKMMEKSSKDSSETSGLITSWSCV